MDAVAVEKEVRKNRSWFAFLLGIAIILSVLYGIKLFSRNAYQKYWALIGTPKWMATSVRVPAGPFVNVQRTPPPFHYKAIDLGYSVPMSMDEKSNLLLYVDATQPPEDLPNDLLHEGLYLRSPKGTYRFLGKDPAQLTPDGHLIEVQGKMGGRTMKVDGEKIDAEPIRDAPTWDQTSELFAAAGGRYLSTRYWSSGEFALFGPGQTTKLVPTRVPTSEFPGITALRKIGVFEEGTETVGNFSFFATADGEIYGQSWGSRGIYESFNYDGGRLCRLVDGEFKLVNELKNIKTNTEVFPSATGTIGLNLYDNCSYMTRPAYYKNKKLTTLPIPSGSQAGELLGINGQGVCVIAAAHPSNLVLVRDGKLYPFEQIAVQAYGKKLGVYYKYSNTKPVRLADEVNSLRVRNSVLEDGSILCLTLDKQPHLVLLIPDP